MMSPRSAPAGSFARANAWLWVSTAAWSLMAPACDGDDPAPIGRAESSSSSAGVGEAGRSSGAGGNGAAAGGEGGGSGESSFVPPEEPTARVVDSRTRRPLAGRRVLIAPEGNWSAAQTSTTNAEGYFTLQASGPYQAVVAEPDGSSVTVYDDLSSSRPVLLHRSAGLPETTASRAFLSGTVTGGPGFPLSTPQDIVVLYLFGSQETTSLILGGGEPPYGPSFAMNLGFQDETTATAQLIAVSTYASMAKGGSFSAATSSQALELKNGAMPAVDVELEPSALTSVRGSVILPEGHRLSNFSVYYRFPWPEARIDFPLVDLARTSPFEAGGLFEYEAPRISAFEARLCISAWSEGAGESYVERCAVDAEEEPLDLELTAAPRWVAPVDGAQLSPRSRLAWSYPEVGTFVVELEPDGLVETNAPFVSVYTTATEVTLPDLSALDIAWVNGVDYRARVARVGSYASLDEALRPEALGAIIRSKTHLSQSPHLTLKGAP